MKLNSLVLIPVTGDDMNTSVFTDAGREAKRRLAVAREAYVAATKAAHPDWIVM